MSNYASIFRVLFIIFLFTKSFFLFSNTESPEEEIQPLSTAEQISNFYRNDEFLIEGILNPLSGNLSLCKTDLIEKGAQNLSLTRHYNPPHIPNEFDKSKDLDEYKLYQYLNENYKGWRIYSHLRLTVDHKNKNLPIFRITEPSGMTFDYKVTKGKTSLEGNHFGITNIQNDTPSGKNDFRNVRIFCEDNEQKLIVQTADGTKRVYNSDDKRGINFKLTKEILPNGKVIKYFYNKGHLESIESLDPSERFTYALINLEGSPVELDQKFSSSTNRTCFYKNSPRSYKIKVKIDKSKPTFSGQLPKLLTSVSSPFYRNETINYNDKYLLDKYSGKNQIFSCEYSIFGNKNPHFKISKLLLPVGVNDTFYPVYDLSYDPADPGKKEGKTTVKKADGSYIIYEFSKNLIINKVSFFDNKNVLKKQKIYTWFNNNWLDSLEIKNGNNKFYKKSYKYDEFGNPIEEKFIGNLEGNDLEQSYTIKRKYSNDGFNNLLYEENEDGLISIYEYLPNTNLVLSKYIKDKNTNEILIREFNEYDACNNLLKNIIDDGSFLYKNDLSNVNERKITKYNLRDKPPFLHMVDSVEEKYLENNNEKLLKKTIFTYDKWGNISREDIFDEDANFVYSVDKEHNERGDLLSETNAIGQKAHFKYDEKGLLVRFVNFSNRINTENTYDTKGRLKSIQEISKDCNRLKFYEYDVLDNQTLEKNSFGKITSTYHEYDSISKKPQIIKYPQILSSENQKQDVTTNSLYDGIGLKSRFTDANGNTTLYKYNSYMNPSKVIHPNGSFELFIYFRNGKLKSHTNQDGLEIRYTYDILGRVVQKDYYFNNLKIGDEKFKYNSFHLIEGIDREGNFTKYTYDGSGKKVLENFEGRITEYSYDKLGRLEKRTKQNNENTLIVNYKRDLLDRITQEIKTDIQGKELYKVAYTYDDDGNRDGIIKFIKNKEAKDIFEYDAFGRLILYTEPEGNVTKKIYDENHLNQLDQKVLKKTTIDPKGIQTIEIFDHYSKISSKTLLDNQENIISSIDSFYDQNGNLIEEKNNIFTGKVYKKSITTKYSYNEDNLISSLTRAYGSDDERISQFTYTKLGKLKTKILPDKTQLDYGYDGLGYLIYLKSTDKKIEQTFKYNKLGNLLIANDNIQNTKIERQLDAFGNIVKETFKINQNDSGLCIEKTYDNFNRPLTIKFLNNGYIKYSYDPLFIRKIDRFSNYDETLYSHAFDIYDLNGNLIQENHLYNLGLSTYEKDLNNRVIQIKNPYFSQSCKYDNCGNLKQISKDNDISNYSYDNFDQLDKEVSDKSNHEYKYDSNYNRILKDKKEAIINDLDELLQIGDTKLTYDKNGNITQKQTASEAIDFQYDPLNRLIHANKEKLQIKFQYDALGRRLSKSVNNTSWLGSYTENYLYDGNVEIGAFDENNKSKNLKILSYYPNKILSKAIAVEINGSTYLPIYDAYGNILKLISSWGYTKEENNFTSFGENINEQSIFLSPWQYQGKRLDPELNLIYFGKRYYDPSIGRWISLDPAGFVDSMNLYQYILNNPFRYVDPIGENLFGWCLGLGEMILGGTLMATGVALEVVTFGGFTVGFGLQESAGLALLTHGYYQTMNNYKDIALPEIKFPDISWDRLSQSKTEENEKDKRHTPDQETLSDLAKEAKKKGVSNSDADIIIDWSKEYGFPTRDDRGTDHWQDPPKDHIHAGGQNHIPIVTPIIIL